MENIPILPIIQSSKVARINNQKRLEKENAKIAIRLEHIMSNVRSEYAIVGTDRMHRSMSPRSRVVEKKGHQNTERIRS